MHVFFRSLIIVGSLALCSNGAFAAESAGHGAAMKQANGMQAVQNGMQAMQSGMAHDMANSTMQHAAYNDKAFLSAMIPHHEAAIVMANDVLKQGKDPQVKQWAEEVIAAQKAEIAQMSAWLKSMGGEDKNAAKAMNDSMHAMMTMTMDKDADRNFVAMMIDHHAGALEMSTLALIRSDNDNIVSLANQIIAAQAKEIMAYRQWLKKNPR